MKLTSACLASVNLAHHAKISNLNFQFTSKIPQKFSPAALLENMDFRSGSSVNPLRLDVIVTQEVGKISPASSRTWLNWLLIFNLPQNQIGFFETVTSFLNLPQNQNEFPKYVFSIYPQDFNLPSRFQFTFKISIYPQDVNLRSRFQFTLKISIYLQDFKLPSRFQIYPQDFNLPSRFSIYLQDFNLPSRFQFNFKISIYLQDFNLNKISIYHQDFNLPSSFNLPSRFQFTLVEGETSKVSQHFLQI